MYIIITLPSISSNRGKCVLLRTNFANVNVTNSRRNQQICAALVWNFRRWAIVLRLYLSTLFPSALKSLYTIKLRYIVI